MACNLWLSFVLQVAQIAFVTTTYLSYAAGPQAAWLAANKWALCVASVVLLAALIFVARLGLRVGKWVTNVGSLFTLITLVALVLMPFAHQHGVRCPHTIHSAWLRPRSLFSALAFFYLKRILMV